MSNVAALWTLKKGIGYEHTGHKVEDTDRKLAYMIVAHCHVATVPPLFQSVRATVHVNNPAASN